VELINSGPTVVKSGGLYGASFRLGTVRWRAIALNALDNIEFVSSSSRFYTYNPQSSQCTAIVTEYGGINPLYVQPWGCMPLYFDQPDSCNELLWQYETFDPLSRICLHWPSVAGPGVGIHRVYYQYDFDPVLLPALPNVRSFNPNDIQALLDRARCRWEAQIDQLTPPMTDVFEWAQTNQGGRLYFTTDFTEINDNVLAAAHIIALTKSARNLNAQWQLVDSSACGQAQSFNNRSEIVFNNCTQFYQFNPHRKWTTDVNGCGGGPDCIDFYAVALHELGHYIGLAHQLRNHETVMLVHDISPMPTLMTQCDADNTRRLYNPARIGYPVDNSYDCSRFTDVAEAGESIITFIVVSDGEEFIARYAMQKGGYVRLELVDVLGHMVAPVTDAELPAGSYSSVLPTGSLVSGAYFVVMKTADGVHVQKFFVTR